MKEMDTTNRWMSEAHSRRGLPSPRRSSPTAASTRRKLAAARRGSCGRSSRAGFARNAVEITEDFKDVLSALVGSLRGPEPAESLCATGQRRVPVHFRPSLAERHLAEQRDLLYECGETGWTALGLSVGEVTRRRSTGEISIVPLYKTDPNEPLPRRALEIPSPEEALQQAQAFLKTDIGERPPEAWEAMISQPDALFALCRALQDRAEVSPALVATEAAQLYEVISRDRRHSWTFRRETLSDGRGCTLGRRSFRHLGKRDEAERWLEGQTQRLDTPSILGHRSRVCPTRGSRCATTPIVTKDVIEPCRRCLRALSSLV